MVPAGKIAYSTPVRIIHGGCNKGTIKKSVGRVYDHHKG